MKTLCLALLFISAAHGQETMTVNPGLRRLPGGRTQQEAIVRFDFRQNLEDFAKLARLAREVRIEFAQGDRNIVSVATLKKLDEIEKLTKNIKNRLKRP